ncbi:MAG: PEP-CTERM sorting domain-containing protein [Deltaproteobacteria bacterium]|nr:PEP-CTERM sorting domain-containing protein [Deltaproteobacteria bacterium]
MKNKLLSSLLIALFVILLSAGQASALSIGLNILDDDITIGEAFTIEVWANEALLEGDKVLAFGFDLTNTDPSVVKFDSYTVGPDFNDNSTSFSDTDVAGSAFPGITADSILLATLNFTALGVGNAEFGIYSDITGHNEGLVYSSGNHVDITSSIELGVTDVTVTHAPEPATMLLLGTGLLSLVGLRKKFRKA